MKLLPVTEARCAGRDPKVVTNICPERERCLRHKQMETDRSMGIHQYKSIKTLSLPRVGSNKCHYFMRVSP